MKNKLNKNDISRKLFSVKIIQKQQHKNPQEIMKQKKNVKTLHESPTEKLKNFLTPIMSYTDLLSCEMLGKLSKSQKDKIELIREQAYQITKYLDSLKIDDISQLEFPKYSKQAREYDLQRK